MARQQLPGTAYSAPETRRYDDLEHWLSFSTVKTWLQSLNPQGQKRRLYDFARYLRWRKAQGLVCDPDEMIKLCDEGTVRTLKRQALELKGWLESEEFAGRKKSSRERYNVNARAFYRAFMIDLPRFKISVPRSEGLAGGISLEQEVTGLKFLEMVKKVLANGKLSVRDRSITLTIVQTFTDDSTLAKIHNYYLYPQLVKFFGTEGRARWDLSKCPAGPIYFTRPKVVEAGHEYDPKRLPFTFMHVDAVEALRDWLDERREWTGREISIHKPAGPRNLATSDPLYIMKDGLRPMPARHPTNVFLGSGKRAKVNIAPKERPGRYRGSAIRYPYHSHELRDVGITLARSFNVDPVAVQLFAGHEIDRLKYEKSPWDNPEFYRTEYDKLGPVLNVISGREQLLKIEYEKGLQERVDKLEEYIVLLKRKEELLHGPE
jgi:hypothetical protein